ncbi:MAG: Crp/Fnr family transcriptional regulator [Muribaculaceae bacterium]|nr:Crp/Fnr family transcriptional regulator [Muribaculaceae bacterium]
MDLPLFQGTSMTKLADIVGSTKFHFLKYPEGEVILREGDPCGHITFIINGSVRVETVNRSGRFSVSHTLNAPAVIWPEFLFGRVTECPGTVTALESVSVLKIAKADYISILESDKVFLFNYINALSVNAQKSIEGILALTDGDIDERIAFWISALTQPGSRDIKLTCRKRDLCTIFGSPRAAFNNALESMHQRGLIDYTSDELTVRDRGELLALLNRNHEHDADRDL